MSNPQTTLTAPPASESKLVNPPQSGAKMTKIRALHGIDIRRLGKIINPGEEFEATDEEVEEFCDRRFKGPYAFDGEHSSKHAPRHLFRRAIRLSEAKELERLAAEEAKMKKKYADQELKTNEGE